MLMGRTPSRGEAQGWLQGKGVVLILRPAPLAVVMSKQRHYLMQPSKPAAAWRGKACKAATMAADPCPGVLAPEHPLYAIALTALKKGIAWRTAHFAGGHMCAYHYDLWIVNQLPLRTEPGKHYGLLLQQRDLVVHLRTCQAGPHGESCSPVGMQP